jgi:hypothetical protein
MSKPEHEHSRIGGSGLFCTPPPGEALGCVDCAVEEEVYISEVPNLREAQSPDLIRGRLYSEACSAQDASRKLIVNVLQPLQPSQDHLFVALSHSDGGSNLKVGSENLEMNHYELAAERCILGSTNHIMTGPSASLTTFAASNESAEATARSHPPNGKTDSPKTSTSNIKTYQNTTRSSVGNGTPYDPTVLGQFTGYSSSDDEDQDQTSDMDIERVEHHKRHIEIKWRNRNSTVNIESAQNLADGSGEQKEPPALQRQDTNARSRAEEVLSITAKKTGSLNRILEPSRVKTTTLPRAAIRSEQSAWRTMRQELHVDMAVHSGVTVPRKRPSSSSISIQSTKRPKLHGPFVDDSASEDEHDIVHLANSASSSRPDIHEKKFETIQDDEHDLKSSSVTPPPKQLLSSIRDPESSTSTKTTKPVDVLKLRKLMLAKKQIQDRKDSSPSDTSTVQRNRATSVTNSVTRAQTSVRDSHGPTSLASTTSRAGPTLTRQGVRDGLGSKESRIRTATKVAPPASRLSSANVPAFISHSASRMSAPKTTRMNESPQSILSLSQIGIVASGTTSQSANRLEKERQGALYGLEATKPRTKIAASPQRFHSSARANGGARVVGDLLTDIRQAGEPPRSSSQPGHAQSVTQRKTPGHLHRTADRSGIRDNAKHIQIEDDMEKVGSSGIPSSLAHEPPASAMGKNLTSSPKVNDKFTMAHSVNPRLDTPTLLRGTDTTGHAVPKFQTSQSISSVPKKKLVATETSCRPDSSASKRPIVTNVLRSPTPQPSVHSRNAATLNETQLLPSMVEPYSAAAATRNVMEAVSSIPTIGPNLYANSRKAAVHETLPKPPGTIEGRIDHITPQKIDQLATPKPKRFPILEENTGASSSKATSRAIDTPVRSQAVLSQPRTETARGNTASVQIPAKAGCASATTVLKDAAAPEIAQTKLPPNIAPTSLNTTGNDMARVPSQTATSRVPKRTHEGATRPESGREGTIGTTLNPASTEGRITTHSSHAKSHECPVKAQVMGLDSSLPRPSTAILAEGVTTSTTVPPPTNVLRSEVTPNAMEPPAQGIDSGVDASSGEPCVDAQQSNAKANEKCTGTVTSSPESRGQHRKLKEISTVVPETSAARSNSAESHVGGKLEPRSIVTASNPTQSEVKRGVHEWDSSPMIILPSAPAVPTSAEPYFEYSVYRKIWSDADTESSVAATELTSIPCTNINEANAHAESLFKDARQQYQQYFQVQFSKWANEPDEHGCYGFVGTLAPIDYPSKITWMKYWVQRDQVSAHAGRKPKDLISTSFVSKTVYVLRLFKLQPAITDPDVEEASATAAVIRMYHPLPRTECYTTLDAANRAAKNLQIELSHKTNPSAMDKAWQTTSLAELNKKLNELLHAKNEQRRHWKSEFNGSGLGSATFELVVEESRLCGPRNL